MYTGRRYFGRFLNHFSRNSARRATTLLALLLATTAAPARAQVTTTGMIRVAATDDAGLPVPGATVTATAT